MAMIIETTDDLLRLLRENEEFLAAARREILTQELLALPQRFAEYSKSTDEKIDNLTGRVDDLSGRVDDLSGRVDDLSGRVDDLSERVDDLSERVDGLSEKVDGLADATRLNTRHIGELKGHFMERATREEAAILASEMGMEWQRTLKRGDVVKIWNAAERNGLTTGISNDDRRSFLRADLVIEATASNGEQRYTAVEISYTADARDTERAIRNAEFLTRFTGIPSYMGIASVHIDNRIEGVLTEEPLQPQDTTKVFWSRLPEMEPAV